MAMNQALLEKIKKLMNLADPSSGAYEAEAMNALRLAKKLMAENNIDIAEVQAAGGKREVAYEFVKETARTGFFCAWEIWVSIVAGNLCETQVLKAHNRIANSSTISFMGTPEDVALSKEIYNLLFKMIKARARAYADAEGSGIRKVYRSYAMGFTKRLWERSKEKVVFDKPKKTECYALMVVDKAQQLQTALKKISSGKSKCSGSSFYDSAYSDGHQDAGSVNLNFKGALK